MNLNKRALIVGIDQYQHLPPLTGCVADALSMNELLQRHDDGSSNYSCRLLTSADAPITKDLLRSAWNGLFDNFDGHVLFHFSGHGSPTRIGGVIATQDGTQPEPGLRMDDLLLLARDSRAKSILLIIDCCFADNMGDPSFLQGTGVGQNQTYLREGLTILAASQKTETAHEAAGHGVFTKLVLGALGGGAADVRGRVSAASVYAYVEQALGPWDQRPMYKSYADRLPPVRLCKPSVPDLLLRELPRIFPLESSVFSLDPSYERTHQTAESGHIGVFNKFKVLRNANLLATRSGEDLYYVAMGSGWVRLTPLGRFYWSLANKGLI
jgi:hypothetical protein